MDRRRRQPGAAGHADLVRDRSRLRVVERDSGGVVVHAAPPSVPTRPSPSVPLQGRPAPPQSPLDTAGTAERGWAGTVRAAWGRAARALRVCWVEVVLAAVGLWLTLWATRGCAP